MARLTREDDGTLTKYAWPGGYPVFYLVADNGVLCADCANGTNDSDASEDTDDTQWKLVACDVNWEDESLYCDYCSAQIESAYGEEVQK